MGLISWMKEGLKNLNIWDIAYIKWSAALFGAIIGAYFANFVKQYLWIIIILIILLMINPIYKMFKKRGE